VKEERERLKDQVAALEASRARLLEEGRVRREALEEDLHAAQKEAEELAHDHVALQDANRDLASTLEVAQAKTRSRKIKREPYEVCVIIDPRGRRPITEQSTTTPCLTAPRRSLATWCTTPRAPLRASL